VEFDRSPFTDIKKVGRCDIGLIEGGVANSENVEVLRDFRRHCDILVAVGACAVNGGVPAMRNQFDLKDCLEEVYINGIGIENPQIPNDPEIPLLLDRVHPIHEVVKVDYFLPGCPPSADTIWTFLNGLIEGREISFPYSLIHYD
jgi:NAD-reducing hydrogenase small subunit